MRQSNVIFGTLIFMFIVYVTMRGQLPGYLDLFKAKQQTSGSTGSGSGITSTIKDEGKKAVGKAKNAAVDAAKAWAMAQLGL